MRPLLFFAAGITLVICIIFAAQNSQAQAPAVQSAQPVWEYKVVHVKKFVDDARELDAVVAALEKNLNSLGAQRWELCHEINGAIIFKRRQ
jgi:hypothetical protein